MPNLAMFVIGAAILSGCAAATQEASQPVSSRKAEPDCSFRSPTTCWALPGRVPSWRTEPARRDPEDSVTREAPPVLASDDRRQ
jgi:hypothetical protein